MILKHSKTLAFFAFIMLLLKPELAISESDDSKVSISQHPRMVEILDILSQNARDGSSTEDFWYEEAFNLKEVDLSLVSCRVLDNKTTLRFMIAMLKLVTEQTEAGILRLEAMKELLPNLMGENPYTLCTESHSSFASMTDVYTFVELGGTYRLRFYIAWED